MSAGQANQVRTLAALHALADIAVGEAALALAQHLDAKADADAALNRLDASWRGLQGMHERLNQAGERLQPALMSQMAQQACEVLAASRLARAQCHEVDARVEDQRQLLHALQNRQEMVQGLHREARAERLAERERLAGLEREEMHLARRWARKDRSWM